MSILLRYVNRTSDDFKSFVSFLNMPQSEKEISYEKLQLILTGISEITEDAEKQSSLIKVLVEKKFKDVIQNGYSDDEIIEQSKSFAKTELEKDLGELSAKHSVLEDKLESHKAVSQVKIDSLETKTDEQITKLTLKELEVKSLKAELKQKTVKENLTKWQNPAYLMIVLGLIIVLFIALQFCFITSDYNYSYKLICNIDQLESETLKTTFRTLMYSPFIGLWLIGTFCWNRLGKSTDKQNKITEFENEFEKNHL
jgi:hypothetical protein